VRALDTVPRTLRSSPSCATAPAERKRHDPRADNKAASRPARARRAPGRHAARGRVELLFTIGEEVGLIGRRSSRSVSCEVPSATPSTLRCRSQPDRRVTDLLPPERRAPGRRRHAGVQPEAGRSAILARRAGSRRCSSGASMRKRPQTSARSARQRRERRPRPLPARRRGTQHRCRTRRGACFAHGCPTRGRRERSRMRVRPRRHARARLDGYRVRGSAPELVLAREALAASGYTPMLTTTAAVAT